MKTTHVKNTRQDGYVALLSTIIIGAVLLVMTIEAGQSGWYTRFMVLGSESKAQSRNLANSCTNQTMLLVITDPSFMGDATTTHETGSCYVYLVQNNHPSSGRLHIRARANVQGSITNLVTEYDMKNIHLGNSPLPAQLTPVVSMPDVHPILIKQIEVTALP